MFRARAIVLALIVGGCGRVGFADVTPSDVVPADSAVDAPPDPCAFATTAPDPLMLSGMTVEATSFNGTSYITEPGTMVTVSDASTNAMLGQAISDPSAMYNVSIATGGQAVYVVMAFAKAGYNPTTIVFARPLTDDLQIDAVLLSSSDLSNVYLVAGQTMTGGGTIAAGLSDCDGNAAADGTISTSPAAAIVYTDTTGQPDASLTVGSFAYAFNVPAGEVQLTANESGVPRAVFGVPVVAGGLTYAVISPIE